MTLADCKQPSASAVSDRVRQQHVKNLVSDETISMKQEILMKAVSLKRPLLVDTYCTCVFEPLLHSTRKESWQRLLDSRTQFKFSNTDGQ
jgi:hypothetical protein